MPLSNERRQRYQALSEVIGHTPFIEVTALSLPRRCRLFAKEEYRNPTGSHYDREMLRLLRSLEEDGKIEPGRTRMLETTTGNSGASFAWLCRALGYPPPIIIIPADMPYARRTQIESFGAKLLLSAAGQYITGISRSFGRFYTTFDSTDPDVPWCPHHWEDEAHGVQAMRECAEEILRDAQNQQVSLDYMVLALGNGSSSRGIGEVLRPRNVTLLGLEPKESPIIAEYLKLPGYEQRRESSRRHGIIGTGPSRESQIYPNMQVAAKMLNDILHVSTSECEKVQERLMDQCGLHVGMSSAGCVAAVERYIEEKQVTNKVFATIFYDPAWKYL